MLLEENPELGQFEQLLPSVVSALEARSDIAVVDTEWTNADGVRVEVRPTYHPKNGLDREQIWISCSKVLLLEDRKAKCYSVSIGITNNEDGTVSLSLVDHKSFNRSYNPNFNREVQNDEAVVIEAIGEIVEAIDEHCSDGGRLESFDYLQSQADKPIKFVDKSAGNLGVN
jgi:hypothetical protein